MHTPPLIVGLGGTTRPGSTSERALMVALEAAAAAGFETRLFGAGAMPSETYDPTRPERSDQAVEMIAALRRADGVLIATPAYHGGISGLVKNAIDFTEDLRDDARPYLDGRAVGLIVVADGAQALGSTLASLRAIVHSLRGWPTPFAATLNGRDRPFGGDGRPADEAALQACRLVAQQVIGFARMAQATRTA
ncbi:MAG: NAD(P)H-dependent oxidoreductase [Burkholderiales bacterium]|nr:NAD(P)H-dependent oxidoreductase [Burkholderiales bacterium]